MKLEVKILLFFPNVLDDLSNDKTFIEDEPLMFEDHDFHYSKKMKKERYKPCETRPYLVFFLLPKFCDSFWL